MPDLFLRTQAVPVSSLMSDRPTGFDPRSREQFDRTRAAETVGWSHRVFTGLPEPRLSNLRFLEGYRFERCTATPAAALALVAAFAGGRELQAGVDRAHDLNIAGSEVLRMAYLLLWRDHLHADLDGPLGLETWVVA